jgi:DNA repair protein SbcD/Mre11
MKLLHTSDWHVGKTIGGRPRLDEYGDALNEVIGIAIQEQVDAVLISGDLYEQRAPSTDADALVFEALIKFYEAGIRVVAIPGNHDGASRFAALAPLLAKIGVAYVADVRPPQEGGIVELPSRDGRESALVACVPFVPERRFGDAAALFEHSESWFQSYQEGMSDLLKAMTAGFRRDRVNVLMAHLFTDGALLGGGEREITIGAAYAISPSRLPANASYIALGHVHFPQQVKGAPAATRYAGSLLQLDFGESDQTKSVYIIETKADAPARVEAVKLSSGRKLVTIRGTLDELTAMKSRLGDVHLRVFVTTDGPVPGMNERVRELMPGAVQVKLEYERHEATPPGVAISSLQPREQFIAYFEKAHRAAPDPKLLAAFDEVLALEQEGA